MPTRTPPMGPFGPGGRFRAPSRGGRGRQPGGRGLGPGGFCVCTNPQCGRKVAHVRGMPCYTQKCPECGSSMARGG